MGEKTTGDDRWAGLVARFERVVVLVLIALLMVVVIASVLELGWLLFRDFASVRQSLLSIEEMLELFGFFLLVLVGLELLTTLKTYLRTGVVQLEVVLEVALIAMAQKLIVLNTSRMSGLGLLGLAGLISALALALFLARRSSR